MDEIQNDLIVEKSTSTRDLDATLKSWHETKSLLASPYLDFVAISTDPLIRTRAPAAQAEAIRAWMLSCIDALTIHNSATDAALYKTILHQRYIAGRAARDVWNELKYSKSQFFRHWKSALGALAQVIDWKVNREAFGSNTTSVLQNAQSAVDLYCAVPRLDAPDIFGRSEILALIRDAVCSDGRHVLVLYGLPGIGKTTLKVALARDQTVLEHYETPVWLSVGRSMSLDTALGLIGRRYGLERNALDALSAANKIRLIAKQMDERPVMIVLDDVWDTQPAQKLITGFPKATFLISTRSPFVAHDLGATRIVKVPSLFPAAAYEWLASSFPAVMSNPVNARLEEIAAYCDQLPLALRVVSLNIARLAYLGPERATQITLERLRALGLQALDSPTSDGTAPPALAASIQLSLDALSPEAKHAFSRLSVIPSKPVVHTTDDIASALKVHANVVDEFVNLGILDCTTDGDLVLHEATRELARSQIGTKAWTELVEEQIERYAQALQRSESNDLNILRVGDCLRQLLAWSDRDLHGRVWAAATQAFAQHLQSLGAFGTAKQLLEESGNWAFQMGHLDLHVLAEITLASVCFDNAQWDLAQTWAKRAVADAEQLGDERLLRMARVARATGLLVSPNGPELSKVLGELDASSSSRPDDELAAEMSSVLSYASMVVEDPATIAGKIAPLFAPLRKASIGARFRFFMAKGTLGAFNGDLNGAIAAADKCLELGRTVGSAYMIGSGYGGKGWTQYFTGDYSGAIRSADLALECARKCGVVQTAITAYFVLGYTHVAQGNFAEASKAISLADRFVRGGNLENNIDVLLTLAIRLNLLLDDLGTSERLIEELESDIVPRRGNNFSPMMRSWLEMKQGKFEQAFDRLKAIEPTLPMRLEIFRQTYLATFAESALQINRLDLSHALAARMRKRMAAFPKSEPFALSQLLEARVALQSQDIERAVELGKQAHRTYTELGHRNVSDALKLKDSVSSNLRLGVIVF